MLYKGFHNLHRRVSGRPEAQIVTPIWIQSCNVAKNNVSYRFCFRCNVKKRYYELGVTNLTERSTFTVNGVDVYCLDRVSGLCLCRSPLCQGLRVPESRVVYGLELFARESGYSFGATVQR